MMTGGQGGGCSRDSINKEWARGSPQNALAPQRPSALKPTEAAQSPRLL